MLLFPKKVTGEADEVRDPPVTRWLRRRYERMLRGIVAHPRVTLAAALLFTLIGCSALPFIGAGFLPELKGGALHAAHGGGARHLNRRIPAHRARW